MNKAHSSINLLLASPSPLITLVKTYTFVPFQYFMKLQYYETSKHAEQTGKWKRITYSEADMCESKIASSAFHGYLSSWLILSIFFSPQISFMKVFPQSDKLYWTWVSIFFVEIHNNVAIRTRKFLKIYYL